MMTEDLNKDDSGVNILSRDGPLWSKLSAEKNNFKIGPETKKFSIVPYVVNF